jgi:hypothetical protein
MAIDRTWYNALVDDTGSGTTGTVWNKAQINGLLNSIDAALATVGGGATALITETVTTGSQPTVTFSSIPATYRDLVIAVRGRGTNASVDVQLGLLMNGDTGTNYDNLGGYVGTAAWAANFSNVAQTKLLLSYFPAASAPANWAGFAQIEIANYRGTLFHKPVMSTGHDFWNTAVSGMFRWFTSGQWRSTAAITSLTVSLSAGAFLDGTVVSLYGRL